MDYTVDVREVATQPIVSIRGRTSMAGLAAFAGEAYGELFGALGRQGVLPAGPPFIVHHDPEFKEEDIDLEVGVPVAQPVEATGRIAGGSMPGGSVAFTLHLGPYEGLGEAYRAVWTWAEEHRREFAGPPREIYLVGVGQAEPEAYRTEVQFPLR
jgi:effector-binding domain-containing protein